MEKINEPTIEILNQKIVEESFPTMSLEQSKKEICDFAERVFVQENYVGKGKTANVFKHPEASTGLCFKHVHNLLPSHSDVDIEIGFLKKLQNLDETVKVPHPVATVLSPTKLKMINGRRMLGKDQALIMEHITGHSLEQIQEQHLELPENFNAEKFFTALENFIHKMHEQDIYHRDLHAGNVMVDYTTGNPVVIDFGRACIKYLRDENVYINVQEGGREADVFLNDDHMVKELKSKFLW